MSVKAFDRVAWMARRGITLVVDAGANIGQTGRDLRRNGWRGPIHSFEPIASCFAQLREASAQDPLWVVYNTALGDQAGTAEIGISQNLVSSSLRPALPELIKIHEPVRYVSHSAVKVARLDAILSSVLTPDDRAYLKIDTQGFEREVIAGSAGVLDQIDSVQMEIAVTEVYEGEMLMPEAITLMHGLGYVLVEAWPAWRHPTVGEVLHFDLLFRRGQMAV